MMCRFEAAMPNRWTRGVQECSFCGASLRYDNDAHECGSRSGLEFNLAIADEQKALLSEAVRKVYRIDEARWYAGRKYYREIVRRHHPKSPDSPRPVSPR